MGTPSVIDSLDPIYLSAGNVLAIHYLDYFLNMSSMLVIKYSTNKAFYQALLAKENGEVSSVVVTLVFGGKDDILWSLYGEVESFMTEFVVGGKDPTYVITMLLLPYGISHLTSKKSAFLDLTSRVAGSTLDLGLGGESFKYVSRPSPSLTNSSLFNLDGRPVDIPGTFAERMSVVGTAAAYRRAFAQEGFRLFSSDPTQALHRFVYFTFSNDSKNKRSANVLLGDYNYASPPADNRNIFFDSKFGLERHQKKGQSTNFKTGRSGYLNSASDHYAHYMSTMFNSTAQMVNETVTFQAEGPFDPKNGNETFGFPGLERLLLDCSTGDNNPGGGHRFTSFIANPEFTVKGVKLYDLPAPWATGSGNSTPVFHLKTQYSYVAETTDNISLRYLRQHRISHVFGRCNPKAVGTRVW